MKNIIQNSYRQDFWSSIIFCKLLVKNYNNNKEISMMKAIIVLYKISLKVYNIGKLCIF